MKPTLSLSAACAPNRLAPAVSITAAAAMRIFLMVSPDTKGWTDDPDAPAPHRVRFGYLSIGYEHRSQCRGSGRTAGPRARNQNEDDDGGEIRQRRHELRRNSKAEALRVQLKDGHRPEQIGADHQPARPPRREHHQRKRDPSTAGRHARDEERRIGQRQISAGEASAGATE